MEGGRIVSGCFSERVATNDSMLAPMINTVKA